MVTTEIDLWSLTFETGSGWPRDSPTSTVGLAATIGTHHYIPPKTQNIYLYSQLTSNTFMVKVSRTWGKQQWLDHLLSVRVLSSQGSQETPSLHIPVIVCVSQSWSVRTPSQNLCYQI